MSVQSSMRDQARESEYSIGRSAPRLSTEVIPNILPTLDALIILLCSLTAGIGYHLAIGGPLEILPQCGVGALASFIYILRMNGSGYYELQKARSLASRCARYSCLVHNRAIARIHRISSQDQRNLLSWRVCHVLQPRAGGVAGSTQGHKDRFVQAVAEEPSDNETPF